MRDSTAKLSDDQARALWRRAAEMQAAAEHHATQDRALQPAESGTLSLEQVTAAAVGAGIDPEYLRIAFVEERLPDAADLRNDHWTRHWLQRLLHEPQTIECERAIAAEPITVLAALRTVAAGATYQMSHQGTVGDDPVSDAVLVYRVLDSNTFGTTMNFADARVLLITIRPRESRTLMRIRVPLFRRGVNLVLAGGFAGIFGGGAAGLAGAAATALGAAAAVAAVPIVIGASAGGVVGIGAFRRLYRVFKNQGARAVEQLLNAVAAEAESIKPQIIERD